MKKLVEQTEGSRATEGLHKGEERNVFEEIRLPLIALITFL